MKLKFNNEDIELVYSFRSNIYFESIQGKNIDLQNLTSQDIVTLFYCVFISTLQKQKKPIIDMLSFLDVIDDNGGDKVIVDFSNWYVNVLKTQFELLEDDNKEEEKPSKKKKKN